MKKLLFNFCAVSILLAFTSCSTEVPQPLPEEMNMESSVNNAGENSRNSNSDKLHIFKGPQVQYGEGKIRSFISLNDENFPEEIGFILTPEVFENLEILPSFDVTTLVPLHQKARQVTPFEHLALKWSLGHGPTFFTQHLDLYFYMISNEERMAIPEYGPATASAFALYPPDGFMPDNYGTPPGQGGVYPQIGKHWLPLNLPDYLPFTSIMVMGTYNGEFIFVEPMATLDLLLSNPNISAPYAQPDFFQESNNYPTRYNIYEDPKTGEIYITLSHFIAR